MITRRILLLLIVLLIGIWAAAQAADKVLYEGKSAYNKAIIVTENSQGLRTLLFEKNGIRQSVVKPGDFDYIELPYVRGMVLGLTFVKQPKRVLIVGLGGGSLPSLLRKHYPKMNIDVVDIDPEVVAAAKKFFGFREDEAMHAHVSDGRRFIEEVREPYDVIFLDAYSAENIPFHLATREFLTAVRRALAPQGVVVSNIWSRRLNYLHDSMVLTYQAVFEEVCIVNIQGSGNEILISLPYKAQVDRNDLIQRGGMLSSKLRLKFDLGEIAGYGYHGAEQRKFQGSVLRDKKPATRPSADGSDRQALRG